MAAPALAIKLRCASWEQLAALYDRDLRRGAFFLKSERPPALGTDIAIDLTLPSGSVISLGGKVARHVPPGARGPGLDVALARIPPSVLWVIESALLATGRRITRIHAPAPIVIPAEPSAPAATAEPDTAAAELDLVQALEAELAGLRKMTPFQVLSVGLEATDEQVREAFSQVAKRYHPDRFARYESERARALAGEIFILARDAYRKIGDPIARATTRTMLRAGRAPGSPVAAAAPPSAAAFQPDLPSFQQIGRKVNVAAPPPPREAVPAGAPAAYRVPQMIPGIPPTARPPSPVPAEPVPTPRPGPRAAKPGAGLDAADLFADLPEPQPEPPPEILLEPAAIVNAEQLLDSGRYDDALTAFEMLIRQRPTDRAARVGRELAKGFKHHAEGNRTAAAAHFESALEIDPLHERAARELAALHRSTTESRRGLLGKLLGRKHDA